MYFIIWRVHLNLWCLEVRFLEELYRECDFRVRRPIAERLIAGLDSHTTHLAVERHVLAENLAKRPRLVLGSASDAFLTKERHGAHQHVGLFLGGIAVDADILSAERAPLALRRLPDGTAFAAGDERDVDSFLSVLDG